MTPTKAAACLQCLSAVSQFETAASKHILKLLTECLQCLSAVSQFETQQRRGKPQANWFRLQCLSAVSQFETMDRLAAKMTCLEVSSAFRRCLSLRHWSILSIDTLQ